MKRGLFLFSLILTLFLINSVSAVWNSSLNDGLVAYWKLDESSGINAVESVFGINNGTLLAENNLPIWVSGKINNAVSFAGTDDWLNITTDEKLAGYGGDTITITAWVNQTERRSDVTIISKQIGAEARGFLFSVSSSGFPEFIAGNTSDYNPSWFLANTTIPLNDWGFVAITIEDNSATYYVNGVSAGSGSVSDWATEGMLVFGNKDYATGDWKGEIDEVGIWNRSLTQIEITNLASGNYTYELTQEVDTTSPTITFNHQLPSDLNLTNFLGAGGVNITYNITDDTALNLSTIKLHYKSNTTNSNIMYYQNGTAHEGFFPSNYIDNSSETFRWNLLDNAVLKGTYNYGETILENTAHNLHSLTASNEYVSIELLNVSNSEKYGFFEIMSNSTSTQRVYYCNSSYGFSNSPLTNPNCMSLYTIPTNTLYNHQHTAYSSHQVVPFSVNETSGKIGNVRVTSTSYFLLRGNTGTSNRVHFYSITNSSRINAFRTTANSGNSWSSQTYTIDAHLHQFGLTDSPAIFYYACANDTSNNEACSDLKTDLFEYAGLPPTSPSVYSPTENTTYKWNIDINYTEAVSPNEYEITNYNISLLNEDLSFNSIINENNGINLDYAWNISLITDGNYVIEVEATDSLGQKSTGQSEIFTINYSQITTCQDLQNMNNDLTKDYFLMNNIDCSDTINWNTNEGFIPIGDGGSLTAFTGIFDGQGYNIIDLFINRSEIDYQGLFSYSTGEIKNVGLIDVYVLGNNYVGGLVSRNDGIIENCSSTGNINGIGYDIGGLVGLVDTNGKIINSYSTGSVTSTGDFVGGLVGENFGIIEKSYAIGNVEGSRGFIGGLVGYSDIGLINNSYATGNVIGNITDAYQVGGLAGYGVGTITNSYATGNVTGNTQIGGLVGQGDTIIENSNATGNVIGNSDGIGGLVGFYNTGLINNSFATGNVTGVNNVGGLAGGTSDSAINLIENSYATGSVTSTGDYVGGFVGNVPIECSIINSYATGSVTSTGIKIGGLIGYFNAGTISNSYSNGSIIGGDTTGGLIGYLASGNIINCSSTSLVIGREVVGGLVAGANGLINNSYATGNVLWNNEVGGGSGLGGLVGQLESNGIIDNSYATGNVTGDNSIGGLVGLVDTNGKIINSYAIGNIIGNDKMGGLVGYSYLGIIENSYAVGNVGIGTNVGGLVGQNDAGTCNNSYWNKYLSGQETSACGDVLNNIELLNQTSYIDWDFTNIWDIQTNSTPYLRFNPEPIFYNNLPLEEEAILISSVSYETPITLNGGTTKEIYILFDTSNELIDDTSAQVIITNGLESRTSSSCLNISNEFNCSITMQFYDSAGSWNINASIENDEANLIENSTESFIVNELNYVTQDFNYVNWGSLTPNTNDNQADNTIILTNGGNQDYPTCNLKAYDLIGDIYSELINASQFSIDNIGSAITGQIYLQNDINIDISSKINLNAHNSSSTSQIFFYTDVLLGLKGDTYHQLNSWEISLS